MSNIQELHQKYRAESTMQWCDHWKTSTNLDLLGDLGYVSDPGVLYENLVALDDYRKREAASISLGQLGTQRVYDALGADILFWTLGNDPLVGRVESNIDRTEALGFDSRVVTQAQVVAKIRSDTPTGKAVLANYDVFQQITHRDALDKIDLEKALQQAAHKDIKLSPKRLARYALVGVSNDVERFAFSRRLQEWAGKEDIETDTLSYRIWLDGPIGCMLTYRGEPQTIVSLEANEPDELFMGQLQKVRGIRWDYDKSFAGYKEPRGVMPISWRTAMFNAAEQLAGGLGMQAIGLIKGKDVPSDTSDISIADAKQAYDIPAKIHGFADAGSHWRKLIS